MGLPLGFKEQVPLFLQLFLLQAPVYMNQDKIRFSEKCHLSHVRKVHG